MIQRISRGQIDLIKKLKAPFRRRLREIILQLGEEPKNLALIEEAELIRQQFFAIERAIRGGHHE